MGTVRLLYLSGLAMLAALVAPATAAAHDSPGVTTSLRDLVLAGGSMFALGVVGALVCWLHLSGRSSILARPARAASALTGLPPWAALPSAVGGVALLAGAFGLYWDAGLHIDNGRDPGPFGNPSHYAVLGSLTGIAAAGLLAIVLARGTCTHQPSIRVARGWRAPVGGVVLALCGLLASSAIPLDEVWHQLFGLDVAIWGPTHVLAIGGGSLATFALWMLLAEGARVSERSGVAVRARGVVNAVMAGGFLLSLTTLHSEFETGFPQYSLLYHPTIVVLSGAIGLTAARAFIGRTGALQAVAVYLVLRTLFLLVVGEGFGLTTGAFPLYLAEAVAVEVVALLAPRRWPLAGGAIAGAAVAIVGLPAEWEWSQQAMRVPWNHALLPDVVPLALGAGVGGGLLASAATLALRGRRPATGKAAWWAPIVGGVLTLACLTWPVRVEPHDPPAARIGVASAPAEAGTRMAHVTVRFRTAPDARDIAWLNVSAWQGKANSIVQALRQVDDRTWTTNARCP